MDLPHATATFIEFKPSLMVNPHPKGLWDKAIGPVAPIINDMIRGTQLNVSIIPAQTMGVCDPISRTCTGMRGLVASGVADFGLTQMPMTDQDPRFSMPHRYGPQVFVAISHFGSNPVSLPEAFDQDIYSMLFTIPTSVLFCRFALLLTSILLLNLNILSPIIGSRRTVGRFTWIDAWSHVTLHPYKSFVRLYRRVLLSVMLLELFWFYQNLLGNAKSDMTVVTPATYLKTLDDIADSNRTVYVVRGLAVDHHFAVSRDPRDRKINKRLKRLSRKDVEGKNRLITDQMVVNVIRYNGIGLFDSQYSGNSAAAFACRESAYEEDIGFRIQGTALSQVQMVGMSFNISQEVERRVVRGYMRRFEGDFAAFFTSSPARINDPTKSLSFSKLMDCWDRVFSKKQKQEAQVTGLPLRTFASVFYDMFMIQVLSFAVLVIECYVSRRRRRIARS